jgi:hydroxymethylglutaryl-CoA lyase
MAGYPRIIHTEEGMRDGLQIESADIPVADKIRLLNALSETGLKEINVGSFVSPKYTPQMAQIDELVTKFTPKPGVRYTYTALNDKGVERASAYTPPLSPRVHEFSTRVDMCDVFAQRNTNRTQAQQIATWPKQIEKAVAKGAKEGGMTISNVWGSNWIGEVPYEQHMLMFDRMYRMWEDAGIPVTKVGMADATGWNMPHRVEQTIRGLKDRYPTIKDFNLHLHNARGTGLASVYAALKVMDSADTLRLQTAIGGMAGCPYCGMGRAAMMIATEDLMHMFEQMGIHTGVNLYKLIEAVWLAEEIVGHPLYGFTSKAGPLPRHDKLYAMDMPHIETLEQAKHFIKGPKAWEGAHSPWKEPITSFMRSEAPGYKEKQEKLAKAKEEPAQTKAASTQPKVAAG